MTDEAARSQVIAATYDDEKMTVDKGTLRKIVAITYYDDQLEFETVAQLVGAEPAQRLRLLKTDLAGDPLDLAAPDDVDVYDGDATAVEATTDDDR